MKIYLIMPVRNVHNDVLRVANLHRESLETNGHEVHYPPRDAPQLCPTGRTICETHRAAMETCDEVHVIWDVSSKGSHFDLGMAYALRKPIVGIWCINGDPAGKSYWKAVVTEPSKLTADRETARDT